MLFPVNQSESEVMTTTEPDASFHFSSLSLPDMSQLHWKAVPLATQETGRGSEERDQLPQSSFLYFLLSTKAHSHPQTPLKINYLLFSSLHSNKLNCSTQTKH